MICRGLVSNCAFFAQRIFWLIFYYFNAAIKKLDIKYIEKLDNILNDFLAMEYNSLMKWCQVNYKWVVHYDIYVD